MIKSPNNTNKRHVNSDQDSESEEDEWVGPKQSEINEENSSDSNITQAKLLPPIWLNIHTRIIAEYQVFFE